MTPAVDLAKKAGIDFTLHEYTHDPRTDSYGLEAADALNVNAAKIFKTLVVETNDPSGNSLAVAIVPVELQLNMKLAAKCLGVKKCQMADSKAVLRSTGYVLGGVSPLGQKRPLATLLDQSAIDLETVFVSAGKRGLEIELAPTQLQELTSASIARLCD